MFEEELFSRALALPPEERARLAEELLLSLNETNEDTVAAGWSDELERRSQELASGEVVALDWLTVKQQILGELERRRAG